MLNLKDGIYLVCEAFQFVTCQFEKNMYFALRFAVRCVQFQGKL